MRSGAAGAGGAPGGADGAWGDDVRVCGLQTATALHSAGQSQAITISGIAERFAPHDIAVTFLNDAWGGTAATDRNLYVSGIQFDGVAVANSAAALLGNGAQHFSASAPANWLG